MKTLTMMLASLFMAATLSGQPTRMVNFYQGNFSSLKEHALSKQKPFFLLFHATWSAVSQDLLTKTLTDDQLVNYVGKHYLAYRVDADLGSRGGSELIREFDVIFYPTMILFAPNGEEQYRFTGFRDPDNLLDLLQKYQPALPQEATASLPNRELITPPVSQPLAEPEKPAAVSPQELITPLPPAPLKVADRLPATELAPLDKPVTKGTGLFMFNLKEQASQGYGLQLGLYAEYANVLREVDRFSRSYDQDILVHITQYRGMPAFRIIMGPFDEKQDANRWLSTVKQQGDVGVVVDLSVLAQP